MFINLTPHAIHLPNLTIEPSGTVARCQEKTVLVGEFNGIELTTKEYGEVQDLPTPQDGVMYITSFIVRAACPDRKDVASPGDLLRDEKGAIVGAKNLAVNR